MASDPRNLRIKVQADRLPDVSNKAQISLRVSAVIDGSDGALLTDAIGEILPWKWRLADGSGTWNPHDVTAWRFWRIVDVTGVPTIQDLDAGTIVTAAANAPADFDLPGADGSRRFHRRLEEEITSIVNTSGLEAALCMPAGTAEVTGRTVFGLVESLTGLPNPVPVANKVFTVFTIDPAPDKSTTFIAAPLFGPTGGGTYTLDPAGPTVMSDQNGDFCRVDLVPTPGPGSAPMFADGSVDMRPSLSWDDLSPSGDPQRLIDMETMLIKRPAVGHGLTDEDWAASLSRRIAEVVDPWARVFGVLDATVTSEITKVAGGDELRRALARDLASQPTPKFLVALDSISWWVVGRRSAASAIALPPGFSILEGLSLRQADFWNLTAALILGAAERDPGSVSNNPRRARFASINSRRLKGLLGLPLDPPGSAIAPEIESIESDDGLRKFVARNWLGGPDLSSDGPHPLLIAAPRVIGARTLTFPPDAQAFGPGATQPVSGAVLDLGPAASAAPIAPAAPTKVAFDLALTPPAGDFKLVVAFLTAPGRPIPPEIRIAGTAASATLDVAIFQDGASVIATTLARGATIRVEIAIIRPDANAAVTVTLSAGGSTPVPADRLLGAAFYLSMKAEVSDIPDVAIVMPDATATPLRTALDRITTGPGLRADLALAVIGPYIPGLTAGRLTWDAPQPQNEQDAAAELPLDERLIASVAALVGAERADGSRPAASLYDLIIGAALTDAGLAAANPGSDEEKLANLLKAVVEAARRDAVRLAGRLVPSATDESGGGDDSSRRLTVDSPPLVFRFDQLQSIAGAADLWTRLSGVGALMARTDTLSDPIQAWRSLNVATLHAPDTSSQGSARAALSEANAVMVRNLAWAGGAIVDPVPLQVGEIGGIRAALLSYDNRSPVAEMATDAALDNVPSSYARRIEAYRFPPTTGDGATDYRLFALSFGYAFHVVPYVIGHGGTLPPILRNDPNDPLTIRPIETIVPLKGQVKIATNTDAVRRSALYRRTRPIGAPRLAGDRSKAIPDGVVPLAGELPIRPAPVTIGGDVQGRFFLDRQGRAGVLEVRAGPDPGLRIDIGRMEWPETNEARKLSITFRGRSGPSEAITDLLTLTHDVGRSGAIRVEAFTTVTTIAAGVDEPEWAEDEFDFAAATQDLQLPASDIAQWRDVLIIIATDKDVDIEPPIVTPIVSQLDSTGNFASVAVGKPRIAPESGHQMRATYVLDGIQVGAATGARQMTIRLQRPTVEFGTYGRWVNPPLFDDRVVANRPVVAKALDAALGVATSPNKTKDDRSLDDPAVTQLYGELVCIFPTFRKFKMAAVGAAWTSLEDVLGFDGSGRRHVAPMPSMTIKVDPNGREGLTGDTATLLPGRIYELRVYAGLPDKQDKLCPFTRDQRLSAAVKATLRHCPIDAKMRLAGPLVLTLEVATEAVPEILGTQPLNIDLRRAPEYAEQAWISLTAAFTGRTSTYPALRYCHLAALESQRWSWRGRPQDDQWYRLATTGAEAIDQPRYRELFDTSFSDRRNDDVGEIFERRIERAHVYGGLRRRSDPAPSNPIPRLFDKSLDWRGGMNLWRFGLRIVSRYKAMRPGRPEFMRSSHRGPNGSAIWQNKVLADRSNDRRPKRPGLAIVLPLTERAMAWGTVPPLLALFNEPLYPNFHVGDGIDAMVEMARHPMTRAERKTRVATIDKLLNPSDGTPPPTGEALDRLVAERAALQRNIDAGTDGPTDALKYWQEHGPDSIRSATGSGGAIIPLRIDGPIGYTFDLATEAGRFDHAGLMITPVKPDIVPWSFVKLKFRRFEAPESIDPATALTGQGLAPASYNKFYCEPRLLAMNDGSNRFRLSNSRKIMRDFAPEDFKDLKDVVGKGIFPAEHEGLAIDIASTEDLDGSAIRFQFTDDSDSEFVRITFSVKDDGAKRSIAFQFFTQLGDAGTWTLDVPAGGDVRLRLIVSARDKPEKGETYKPAGDIAVRARIARDTTDEILSPSENRWLSVACLPLTSAIEVPINQPLTMVMKATGAQAAVSPARLSTFTPSLWWQFAEPMSLFDAVIDGVASTVSTDDLIASVTGTIVSIERKPTAQGPLQKLQSLAPAADQQAGELEEVLVLVLTRNIHDALDRVRERPVAVKLWDGTSTSLNLVKPDWPTFEDPNEGPKLGDGGQIRFLRILRPKTRAMGGYLETAPSFPLDFFQYETIEGDLDMNPPDAKGMVLGMSMPIPWKHV
ncbi:MULTISPECIES: hypothetical protein [unclassified Bradyrhizobium]|uniref:hypothetical protein n=1 Tax=unclassified Bradyrhizobium TaxID=2631580 RepID=UPI001CD794F4|nr:MULTISPECIES: hypothetical protein [unclassified Bradyrhizobium]MCA1386073.1 hypothetical protein [Bradyrhizobium sp. BRP05]MCA1393871.1 hypothetical protein [Bradyrhizobium sp. IC3123]MCA1423515.1 hypothetical protein [Bradyrhizobium sp. BRP23]MCA1430591.1 hypothetical protein [Bradyrhizobium sp. NBAIM16]MCA1480102.1 hypothetical protein [Bradyrhizobium sp. NBAIM08]